MVMVNRHRTRDRPYRFLPDCAGLICGKSDHHNHNATAGMAFRALDGGEMICLCKQQPHRFMESRGARIEHTGAIFSPIDWVRHYEIECGEIFTRATGGLHTAWRHSRAE